MKTILVFITVAVFVLSSEAWFVKKSKRGSVELTIPHGGKMGGNDEPSEREKTQQMIRAGKMLGTVIGKLIGIAGASATGGVITIGVTVVSFFLKELTKDKRSMWQQIEDKVDIKIGQKLSAYHVERLRNEVFRVLETRFQQPNGFSSADLKVVLDKRHMVFPHNWQVLGWSYDLPLGIIYWMPFMIAGYQQMIKEKKQPTCSLANELARTRAHIITSMKAMLQKRYAQLHGTKYSTSRVNYPCTKKRSKRYLGLGGGEKVCVSIDRLMTWDDGLDGKKFTIKKRHQGWVGDNWDTKINKIRDETVEFLWKEVVEKVNQFFDPEICLETLGCSCPTKIKKSEISFSFPSACMADGADRPCMHPCDDFGYSYEWCFVYRSLDVWSYCSKPDLNDCMPITVPPIKFPNVFPMHSSSALK